MMKAIQVCEVCRREGGEITTHHLVLRTRHKNKKNKKRYTPEGSQSRPVYLCRPCHKWVHMLTDKEVAQYF